MWSFIKDKLKQRNWTNRKMAFVSILIATSVAFILVFSNITPVAAVPSFKLAAGGLPVKLTGYIFGPIIGVMTGVISDLLSTLFKPVTFHIYYTLAWAAAGLIPGVIGYLFNRKWRPRKEVEAEFANKHDNINFIITIVILAAVIASITSIIYSIPNDSFQVDQKIIHNKNVFLAIALTGMSTMFVSIFIFRFVLKPKTFNDLLPIIVFSALLEVIVTPLLTLGDINSLLANGGPFLTILAGHMLLSPLKIWGNMVVILIAHRVVAPLIYNKQNNGWTDD